MITIFFNININEETHKIVMLLQKAKAIDCWNAEALIDGFHKNGKRFNQAIYCRPTDLPDKFYLTIGKYKPDYELSDIGKILKGEEYNPNGSYLAIVDTEYKLIKDKEKIRNFWNDACTNDLFDIWDPENGPVLQMSKTKMRTVCLLRLYKIKRKFIKDIDYVQRGRHHNFLNPPEINNLVMAPIIPKDDFEKIRQKLEDTLFKNAVLENRLILNNTNSSSFSIFENNALDIEDLYQEDSNTLVGVILKPGPIEKPKYSQNQRGSYLRMPGIAKTALINANYLCEFDNNHKTFLFEKSMKNYMEAHHLIPMGYQDDFENSIDVPENIICLCPNCHRAIHKSLNDQKREMLEKLFNSRKELLEGRGIQIEFDDLISYYL